MTEYSSAARSDAPKYKACFVLTLFFLAGVSLRVASVLGQSTVKIRQVKETRWKEGPLDSTTVDWSLFPDAYGILANEPLMYPVDVSGWPLKIGPERQLFVGSLRPCRR
jgi:hypothetical protein